VNWGDTTSGSFQVNSQGALSGNHSYVDNGTYTVSVTVTDKDSAASNTITFQVTVNNVVPVVTPAGNQSANEGASTVFNIGSFSDLGVNDNPWTVNIAWGDTNSTSFTLGTQGVIPAQSHTYVDSGTYTVTVTVTDKDGGVSAPATFQVVVNNLAPVLTGPSNQSSNEGANALFNLGSFTDAGTADNPWTVNVNWGDTTSGSFQVNAQGAISRNHTYADNGTYTVSVFVTDKDGANSNTITFQVTVSNLAPILTAPGNQSAPEGTSTSFNLGSFSDAGTVDNPWTVNVNWGDTTSGSFQVNAQGAISGNHTYADNGTFTVSVFVTDKDGATSNTITFQVTVNNVAPILTGPGNQSANEGANVAFNLGSFTDPGVNDNPWTVNVNWGDTTSGSFQVATQGALSRNHTYADNGTYTVTVTVTDKDGGVSNVATFQVVVSNLAPVLTGPSNQSANEGANVAFNLGSFTDAGVNDNPWTVNVSWGDTTSGSFQVNTQGALSRTHTYADNGTYTVTVTVTDKDGGISNVATFQVVVSNLAPVLTGPANQSSSEGSSIFFNLGSFTDAGVNDNPWTVNVVWGDTTSSSFQVGSQGAIGFNHTFADNGTYVVSVSVTDKDGGVSNTATFQVVVSNLAPVLTGPGNQSANEGNSASFNLGSFTDPGINDNPWTVAVTWGDTGSNSFTVGTQGAINFNHTYQDNGTYTVNVTVTDKDGAASNTISFQVTVANLAPGAGSLTNNGPVNEGSPVTVSFVNPTDPSPVDAGSLHYSFALTAAGLAANYAAAGTVNAASFTFADNGSYVVFGRVYDKDGGISTTFQTTVIVNNVAPTVTSFIITGGLDADGLGQPNVPISFQAAATDPGALDSFTYEFDWNYNGTTFNVQDTIGPIGPAGRSPVNINHTYTAFGSYQPAVRVTDKDGSTSVIFLGPQVNVGSVFMSGGNLIIYGTNAMDNIAIDGTNRAAVRVSRNSQVYNFGPYDLSAGGRVIVYCRDGNDVVTVTGTVSTEIYGGNGNDNLNGGGGNDVIFGEAGDDYIALGSGDDVGIGGMGKDQLTGGNGNDVLVGGHVSPLTYNWAQLQSVVGTWNSWNSTGLVPPPLTALRDATTDPADLANMDNYYGDTGKDLFIYRSTGPAPDKISLFSPAEKDYLLALL
jgi:PKD repeat protein